MKESMAKARATLATLPRCTAKSKQTQHQCKLPGLGAGGKCRFHGGRSTGRPVIHGNETKEAQDLRDYAKLMVRLTLELHGGKSKFQKFRLSQERVEELLRKRMGNP